MIGKTSDSTLDAFDIPIPLMIDPAVFERNLAALAVDQPALAQLLRRASIPMTWRPVFALDDWPTWRCESPGEPASWLCDSAVPRTRADALLSIYQPGDLNATLPSLACGAELALLLERLPRHKAVFVFESDEAVLAAVLRVIDLSEAIAAGRCILLHSDQLEQTLAEHLDRWPALLPPGNIMLIPGIGDERVQSLRAIVERFAGERLPAQSRAFEDAITSLRSPPADSATRFGIVCAAPQRGSEHTAAALLHAARQIRQNASEFVVRGPRDVHPLAAARWAAAFQPSVTLCVGHRADLLPPNVKGAIYEWLWTQPETPPTAASRATSTLYAQAADPGEGTSGGTGQHFFPFAADERLLPIAGANAQRRALHAICLVADRPLDNDETHTKMQPTHQLLWTHLRNSVRATWNSSTPSSGEAILASVERATGISIGEVTVRPLFIDAIERVLLTGAICHDAMEIAAELQLSVMAIGGGWTDVDAVTALGEDTISAYDEIHRIATTEKGVLWVFANAADAWPAALANASIAGFPILRYAHSRVAAEAAARNWPADGLKIFRNKRELREQVRGIAEESARRFQCAAEISNEVSAKHSWSALLRTGLSLV